jgi:NADPH2:quinone reductase
MKAIRVSSPGASDVMKLEEVPTPKPGQGELLVKIAAAGLNYIDTYQRSGLYKMPLPFTPGNEAAGTVESVGPGVSGFSAGDPVAYTGVTGSYAEYAIIPAAKGVKVPKGMDLKVAASIMLQGMTAHYLAVDTYPLKKGDWCLVHAGAGGVGLLLIQMAKMRGANVITTVSTPDKAKLAKDAGADHVILYTQVDFEAETKKIVGDRGVDVVYDAVGKTTFDKGLNVLRRRGLMVLYGASSGPVGPMDLQVLNAKGSIFVTRPSLVHHTFTREELEHRAGEVMGWVTAGKLKVRIGATYPLAQAKQAHDDLEGRKTTGKVLLIP